MVSVTMLLKPRYKKLTIDGFMSSLEGMDKSNRWVGLKNNIPSLHCMVELSNNKNRLKFIK